MKTTALDVALRFIDRINHRDLGGMVALMTEDHRFVDGLGQEVRGREQMAKGWAGYFLGFRTVSLDVDDAMSDGTVAAMFGSAQGTYSGTSDPDAEDTGRFLLRGRASSATRVSANGASMLTMNRFGR